MMFHNEKFLGEIGKQVCLAIKKKFFFFVFYVFKSTFKEPLNR